MEFITVTDFGRLLRQALRQCHRHAARRLDRSLGRRRRLERLRGRRQPRGARDRRHGRGARKLAAQPRAPAAGTPRRADRTYESMTLFDEHTWGAYSSVEAPNSLFSRAQWNRKAGFAYTAAMEGPQRRGPRRQRARRAARHQGPGGHLQPRQSRSGRGLQALGHRRSAGDQHPALGAQGHRRGARAARRRRAGRRARHLLQPRQLVGRRAGPIPAIRRVAGTLPAMGYAFLNLKDGVPASDLKASGATIENQHYRVTIDAKTGAIAELFDKALGHDFAGNYQGWRTGPIRLRDGRLIPTTGSPSPTSASTSRSSSPATRTRPGCARRPPR